MARLQLNATIATRFWRQQLLRIKAEWKKYTYICRMKKNMYTSAESKKYIYTSALDDED